MDIVFIIAVSFAAVFGFAGLILGHKSGTTGDVSYIITPGIAPIAGAIIGLIVGILMGFMVGLFAYNLPFVVAGVTVVITTIVILEKRRIKAEWAEYEKSNGSIK